MAHFGFDDTDALMSRIGMDLDVASASIGRTIRDGVASRLRNRIRGMRGVLATDVTVVMTGGTASKAVITLNVRDELDDAVKRQLFDEFQRIMSTIGAVEAGMPMSGPPAPGLINIIERG